MVCFENFHFDFKNCIGFAAAIWETGYPLPYFRGSKIETFKGKGPV